VSLHRARRARVRTTVHASARLRRQPNGHDPRPHSTPDDALDWAQGSGAPFSVTAARLNPPHAEPGRVVHVRYAQLAPPGPATAARAELVDLFMWELNKSPRLRRTTLATARRLRRERCSAARSSGDHGGHGRTRTTRCVPLPVPAIRNLPRSDPGQRALRRTPTSTGDTAEGEGFEPSVGGLPLQRFSRPPRSTTPAPLRDAPTGVVRG
jgi:hypothetical protein